MSVPKQTDVKLQAVTKENVDLNLTKNDGGSSGKSPVVVNNNNTSSTPAKNTISTKENMYQNDPTYRDSLSSSFDRSMG